MGMPFRHTYTEHAPRDSHELLAVQGLGARVYG